MLLCCVGEVRVLCRRVPGAECRWEGTTGEFTSAELAVCVLCVMLLAFFIIMSLCMHDIVLKFQSLTIDEIKDMVQGDKQRK